MKKYIILALTLVFINANAQSRGVRIAYIDMEYILEKVPSYAEAKNQLEQKAQKWKQEIEEKKVEVNKKKDDLKSEKVLLTKELLEEREEEISFLETELLEYQQKRFGPTGDLMVQKAVLVKPVQDQVFNAVQDIAEVKKYDFVFDRSSDLTMLYAAKKNDISDRVIQVIVRAERKEVLTKKQLKLEEEADKNKELLDDPDYVAKEKTKEDKKQARIKLLEDRKLAAEEKRKEVEEKRKQALADKENKTGTVSDNPKKGNDKTTEKSEEEKLADEQKKADQDAAKNKILEDRKKALEDRKKVIEEKRLKAIADREAAKKAKEELKNKP
jgi:Skp family chaperone for outer membrane proteins